VVVTEQTLEAARPMRRLTFEQLSARSARCRESSVVVIRDELRAGRLRLDGDRYSLVPGALPPELVAALTPDHALRTAALPGLFVPSGRLRLQTDSLGLLFAVR
jgi:hypothetical protein